MKERVRFRSAVTAALADMDPRALAYDESEFWMIRPPYEYIQFYALDNCLWNTAIALPLARGLHNGVHRKGAVIRGGVSCRLPYVIHCLQVCRMLADLKLPLPHRELDILLASALCHDMIEDLDFPEQGRELVTAFHLDPEVYETVRLLTKRRDFTPAQEQAHFRGIAENRLALLVKLSDRSHNVEDLYNMSVEKVHEYVGETERFFLPMCSYGMAHYPELGKSIEMLRDKIFSLTLASRIMVDRCEARERELQEQLRLLKEENAELRREFSRLWQA